jgi:ATP-dependent helicase/nuclease subunit A
MSADQVQRRRAIEETDRSFVVEASAGTGKTSILIRRILHCVLECGPKGAPVPLSRICAITFTEKAAGEMKIRLRQEFERRAASAGAEGARARQALLDLESAAISTFHAFAVSLLKERPIEAGLDPRFTALDEIQSQLFFQRIWDAWLQRAIQERRPQLEQVLRKGLGLEALRSAAGTLRMHAQTVRRLRLPSPPTEAEMRQRLHEMLHIGSELRALNLNPGDKLLPLLDNALSWLVNPAGAAVLAKPGTKGSTTNWKDGKETVESVREFIRAAVDLRAQSIQLPAQRSLWAMLRLIIDEFLPEWQAHKRAEGYLDFDDQLWCTHELLSTSPAARKEFQERYAALLVDEFQDTDPIQWEIICLLASSADNPEFAEGAIAPGRLFIVGDPKQSIYRFRGADIETYAKVTGPTAMTELGLESLELTTNFRSVPSILNFVDQAFCGAMSSTSDKPYQPKYLAFGGRGAREEKREFPCVYLLGDRNENGGLAGSGREFITIESTRIARLIASIQGNADWEIQRRPDGAWRTPRLRDIAVLMPVLTHADALEDALREVGIPYVLEGGRFYYARSEVSSAITVLRSIANPNDGVALYGALRSIFFGISDEDLVRARADGLPLDYRGEVPSHSKLHRPYHILQELHLLRHPRTASETLENLLQQTGAREVLALRGVQSLANLNKLARTLRALQQDATFSEVVELVGSIDEEEAAESESRIMEEHSDAVRILSIHRSKGLDFPIVIAAGFGLQRRSRNADFLADRHAEKIFGLSVGSKESGLQTPGWNDLVEKEKERDAAELTRLLYVALTRACDHLVLCTHMRGKRVQDTGEWTASFEKTRLKPLAAFLPGLCDAQHPIVSFLDVADLATPAAPQTSGKEIPKGAWRRALVAQYEELDRLLSETPAARGLHAAPSGAEDLTQFEADPDSARDRAVRLGIAFHEAMDGADLSDVPDADLLAEEAGMRQRLDGSGVRILREMLNRSLGSALMMRARNCRGSGRRVWRELPYVRSLGSHPAEVEEGKIDLLFEEADGWVLVDYKTDRIPEEPDVEQVFAQKYGGQVKVYVTAMKALGVKVKAAYLLLARTGAHIEIPS